MFSHILVSTDGSRLSQKAVKAAVRQAKASGARLTGVYVIQPYAPLAYGEGITYVPAGASDRYRAAAKRAGRKALASVEIEAQTAGVESGSVILAASSPWEGIIRTAKAKNCDLIVMASHGRKGLAGLLLGSETAKVLTHSKIPVLVCR
jgi:nucleotide-binding universal stress UspA family protein